MLFKVNVFNNKNYDYNEIKFVKSGVFNVIVCK